MVVTRRLSDATDFQSTEDFLLRKTVHKSSSNAAAFAALLEAADGAEINLEPGATYYIDDPIIISGKNININGNGARIIRGNNCGAQTTDGITTYQPAIRVDGGFEWVRSVSAIDVVSTLVVSNASGESYVARLSMADITGIVRGDNLRIYASDLISHGDRSSTTGVLYGQTYAEAFQVTKVEVTTGSAGYVFLSAPLRVPLVTNIRVAKYKSLSCRIVDLEMNDNADAPNRRASAMLEIRSFASPKLRSLRSTYIAGHFVRTRACFRTDALDITALRCVTDSSANTFGYGVQAFGDTDGVFHSVHGVDVRHAITTAANYVSGYSTESTSVDDVHFFGGCVGTIQQGGRSDGGQNAGFDMHGDARYCGIVDAVLMNNYQGNAASQQALQLRGYKNFIRNCTVVGPGAVTVSLQGDGCGEHHMSLNYIRPVGCDSDDPAIRIMRVGTSQVPRLDLDIRVRGDGTYPGFVVEAEGCDLHISDNSVFDVKLAPATYARGGIIQLLDGAKCEDTSFKVDISRSSTSNLPAIVHAPVGTSFRATRLRIKAGGQFYALAMGWTPGTGAVAGGTAIFSEVHADRAPFHNGTSTINGFYQFDASVTAAWSNLIVNQDVAQSPCYQAPTWASAGTQTVSFARIGAPVISVVPNVTATGVIASIATAPLFVGQRLLIAPTLSSTADLEMANSTALPAHKSLGISAGEMCEYVGGRVGDGTLDWLPVRTVMEKSYYVGASTGSTSEATLRTLRIPGGALGANGQLTIDALYSATGSAGNKNVRARLVNGSGTTICSRVMSASQSGYRVNINIGNSGSVSAQSAFSTGGDFGAATSNVSATVNTASAWNILLIGSVAASPDTATLERVSVKLAA